MKFLIDILSVRIRYILNHKKGCEIKGIVSTKYITKYHHNY